jgi:molybdopterin-guanine dinucleotide biosynthesis protein B
LKPVFIAIVGPKKSGKTATIETLTEELTRRRYRVAVIKHIPETSFTIDTKGKDTWRFAKAGATKIISISSNEIATIEKTATKNLSLEKLLERSKGSDIVFIEGFRNLVSRNRQIHKVVVIRSSQEAKEAIQTFEPIIALAGEGHIKGLQTSEVYFDILKDSRKLADMIDLQVTNSR